MAFKSLKQVLLAKIESVYGTDPTPTGGADAMLVSGVKLSAVVQEAPDRPAVIRPWFSNEGKIPASRHVTLDFDLELAGSAAAGTIPSWNVLMRACAMSSTNSPGVSTTYVPISASEESATFHFNVDGKRHIMTGGRGSFSLKFSKGEVPMLSFKFVGLYTAPTATALPTPTLSGFVKPVAVTQANTTPVTLHSFAGLFSEISLDIGNTNSYLNLMGAEKVVFTGRKPAGSCTMEMPTLADKDWYAIALAGTTGTISIKHGQTAANIITVTAPVVQITNPEHSSSDNIEQIGLTLDLQPSAGNDELSIVVT